MNKQVEMLRLYNQWRRGDIDHLDSTAQEIGEAIDAVLEQHADMLEALEKCTHVLPLGEEYDLAVSVIAKAKGEQG